MLHHSIDLIAKISQFFEPQVYHSFRHIIIFRSFNNLESLWFLATISSILSLSLSFSIRSTHLSIVDRKNDEKKKKRDGIVRDIVSIYILSQVKRDLRSKNQIGHRL